MLLSIYTVQSREKSGYILYKVEKGQVICIVEEKISLHLSLG